METIIKHKGKALVGAILFGIAVIGSAFIGKTDSKTVDSKAEKNESKTTTTQQVRFYNISGVAGSTDPNNFEYAPVAPENCADHASMECSALWTVELPSGVTSPSPGDKPNDFLSYTRDGGAILGKYQP